ncbi:MarR family transcriptional regulator [Limibacter armeniacum]|uniref:MarR family winged helix-turn-helix transcriptional regulator n=1 Tax=Limibacter armeniacum TaxID=466084 RepID=UPI002FE57320
MEIAKEIKQKEFKDEWQKLSVNLTFTHGWAMGKLKDYFNQFDITLQQFNILRILKGQYPSPISTSIIRDRMIDKMSDTSRLVDRLSKKGLVERETCKTDRRLVDVIISQAGLDLLETVDKQYQALIGIYNNLSEEEAKQLNMLLDKLRD